MQLCLFAQVGPAAGVGPDQLVGSQGVAVALGVAGGDHLAQQLRRLPGAGGVVQVAALPPALAYGQGDHSGGNGGGRRVRQIRVEGVGHGGRVLTGRWTKGWRAVRGA
jgi:hypothetical protein